jgi:hypothetical protein
VKEAVFHPDARVEVEQSVEFYETRLDGLGLRFLPRLSKPPSVSPSAPRRVRRLPVTFASASFPAFRTASSIVSGRTTSILSLSRTSTAARTTGGSERTAANQRVDPTGVSFVVARKRCCAGGSRAHVRLVDVRSIRKGVALLTKLLV